MQRWETFLFQFPTLNLQCSMCAHTSGSDSDSITYNLPLRGDVMQLFFLEVAFEEGTGDVIIVLVGDRMALSRVSCLDGVLLFDGCWREGDPVWKRKKSKPLNHIEAHSHWAATRRKETSEEKRRRWVKNKQINNLFADDIFTDLMSSFSILTLQLDAPLIIIWYDDCEGGIM